MNRGTALSLAVALLVAASLGLAAATLDSAVQPDAAAGDGVQETSDHAADGRMDVPQPPRTVGVERDPCIETLAEPPVIAAILLALALLFAYVRRISGSTGLAGAVTAGAAVPTGTAWNYLTDCTQIVPELEEEVAEQSPGEFASPDSGGLFDSGAGAAASSPTVLVGLAVFAVLGLGILAAVLHRRSDDEDEEPEAAPEDERDADVTAARRAAGAAADRIDEGDDVDNEVFRAWREMADSLDVAHPAASTPGEFARAAVESGLDPEAVAALTNAFEQVRYGGVEATADRETAAIAALRRIESAGVDVDGDTGDGTENDTSGDSTGDGTGTDANAAPDGDGGRR